MSDSIWNATVVLIIPLAISGLFYWRASIALDRRMDELDRLIHQLARVVKDPGSITLNPDGSITIDVSATAHGSSTASAEATVERGTSGSQKKGPDIP